MGDLRSGGGRRPMRPLGGPFGSGGVAPAARLQKQSFRPPFSKGGGFQRQRLWPPSADGGTLYTLGVFGGLGAFTRERPPRPLFLRPLGGGGLPDGEVAPQGPEGALAICLLAPSGGFGGVFPPGVFRHPAGGVVGSRPDRRVTFLRGQESNQRNRRGPLPAPWTPGAVGPDLQPLLAFNLEPSSGLRAA